MIGSTRYLTDKFEGRPQMLRGEHGVFLHIFIQVPAGLHRFPAGLNEEAAMAFGDHRMRRGMQVCTAFQCSGYGPFQVLHSFTV